MWYARLFYWHLVGASTMVGCIQSRLRALAKTFYRVKALVDAKGNVLTDQHGNPEVKVPNPRIKLPYTYLVAWYAMYCPSLMTTAYTSGDFVPFLQKLERSTWQHAYIIYIRRVIQSDLNYQLVRCLPDIQDRSYGDQFLDIAEPDGYTTLSTGVFCWLMSIRPGYLVFRQGDTCTIEPYLPSRFAR